MFAGLSLFKLIASLKGGMKPRFFQHVISTFGITVVQQIVGLARQILIAACFGISREYDHYLVVYAVAAILIFNMSAVFDTVAVSRLARIRESDGGAAFWRTSNRLFVQALIGGLIFAGAFLVLFRLLLPVIAAGFSEAERAAVMGLAMYFVPWIVIILPYYAASAHLKALWGFHWVFGAETVAIVVSAIMLWFWHSSIETLPLAYLAGYSSAFAILLCRRGFRSPEESATPVALLPAMGNQHLANQIGGAAGLADRYFQSYLQIGGISALGYAGLIVNNLSSLMTFREIYVVPLSTKLGRDERLERMLQGVMLISVPCVFFVAEFAAPIVKVLFQRGSFTAEAAILTADLLQIMALSLVISSILAPLARLFQILDRISYSHVLYLVSLVGTASFQYLLVFRLGWGAHGVAWAALANSALVTLVVAWLVRRCGVIVNWRNVLQTAVFAAAIAGGAVAVSWLLASHFQGLVALVLGGFSFGLFVAASYFLGRGRLLLIIG